MDESYECIFRDRVNNLSFQQYPPLEEPGMVDIAGDESVYQSIAKSTSPQPITSESSSTPPPLTIGSSSTLKPLKTPIKVQEPEAVKEPEAVEEPETLEEDDTQSNGSISYGEKTAYQERYPLKDPCLSDKELKMSQSSSIPSAQKFPNETSCINTPPDSHKIKTECGLIDTIEDDSSSVPDVKPKIEINHYDGAENHTFNDDLMEYDFEEGLSGVNSKNRGSQIETGESFDYDSGNEEVLPDDFSEYDDYKDEKAILGENQTNSDLRHGKNGVISRKRRRRKADETINISTKRMRGRPRLKMMDDVTTLPKMTKAGKPNKTDQETTVSYSKLEEEDDDDDSFWRVSEVKLDAQNLKDKKERRAKGIKDFQQRKCRFCHAGKDDDPNAALKTYIYNQYTQHKFDKHGRIAW